MLVTEKLFPVLLSSTDTFKSYFPYPITKPIYQKKQSLMFKAPQLAGCPDTLLPVPSREWDMNVKEKWDLRPCTRWLYMLMTRKVAFHQNRHAIKTRGDMGTSSLSATICLKNEPDEKWLAPYLALIHFVLFLKPLCFHLENLIIFGGLHYCFRI